MPSCVVKSCKNYLRKCYKLEGITYHTFPKIKNRDEWILIIRESRGETDWNPSSTSTICSAHFDYVDFITTPKGRRMLVPYAIPKRLLSNSPETITDSSYLPMQQFGSNSPETITDSTYLPIQQTPELPDDNGPTVYCRLCASNCVGKLVNVHTDIDLKKLVLNMTSRLSTYIDFSQGHLPSTICLPCIKSLYTAYDFVVGIDLAQTTLNKMSMKENKYIIPDHLNFDNESIISSAPLQQIKKEPDYHEVMLQVPHTNSLQLQLSPKPEAERSTFSQSPLLEIPSKSAFVLESPRKRRLIDNLDKKTKIITHLKKALKKLQQKVRRLRSRNELFKVTLKNLKDRNNIGSDVILNENIVVGNIKIMPDAK